MILLVATTLTACVHLQDESAPAREPVVLQHVLSGVPEPELDAVVTVRIDGAVVAGGEVLVPALDDSREDSLEDILAWLASVAQAAEAGPGQLLVRAEANAPFARCARLLAGAEGWSVSFAVGDAAAPDLDEATGGAAATTAARSVLPLPRLAAEEEAGLALRIRVAAEGRRLMRTRLADEPWNGEGRYRWDAKSRRVVFALGPNELAGYAALVQRLQGMRAQLAGRLVSISAGPGVTTGEVLLAVDALRGAGAQGVAWTPFESPK